MYIPIVRRLVGGVAVKKSNKLSITKEQMSEDKTSFQPHYDLKKTTSKLHYHSDDW